MKLGSLANGVCRICGSDTITGNDIGCSCQKMYNKATFIILKNHPEDSIKYNYSIEMNFIMTAYQKLYDSSFQKHNGDINKMFKTDFNRSFFPSVISFYKEKGFVSKKQLDIVKKRMFQKNFDDEENNFNLISDLKKKFINNFKTEHDSEIIEVARNLWKSKKISYLIFIGRL